MKERHIYFTCQENDLSPEYCVSSIQLTIEQVKSLAIQVHLRGPNPFPPPKTTDKSREEPETLHIEQNLKLDHEKLHLKAGEKHNLVIEWREARPLLVNLSSIPKEATLPLTPIAPKITEPVATPPHPVDRDLQDVARAEGDLEPTTKELEERFDIISAEFTHACRALYEAIRCKDFQRAHQASQRKDYLIQVMRILKNQLTEKGISVKMPTE